MLTGAGMRKPQTGVFAWPAIERMQRIHRLIENDVGQLGNSTPDGACNYVPHPLPAKIQLDNYGAPFTNIVMVAARDWHNIAVKANGSVWQWGVNDQGQCGDNTTIDRYHPVQVSGLGPKPGCGAGRVGRSLTVVPTAPGFVDLHWQTSTGAYSSLSNTPQARPMFCSRP